MTYDDRLARTEALDLLLSARRVGFVFSGGCSRCVFQIGVIETLLELGVRPALCVGVSGGAWNAATVAVGTTHRLRHYWRAFARMPPLDFGNLLREQTPFRYAEMHRRTFRRYVGVERLRSPDALPVLIGVTRLRDKTSAHFDLRLADDPLNLMLASNYLPPFYTRAPRIGGERCGDGGLTDNVPYREAFAQGCDAVVLVTMKGESEGGLYRNPRDTEHLIPAEYRQRTVVIRPRHRLPVAFTERRWEVLRGAIELGRLRSREVLLGESHAATHVRAEGAALTALLVRLLPSRAPEAGDGL